MNQSSADPRALLKSSFANGSRNHRPFARVRGAGGSVAPVVGGREIDVLMLAYAAQRPLLVRGEPGAGKT